MRHMICSSLGLPKTATLNDYLAKPIFLIKPQKKLKKQVCRQAFIITASSLFNWMAGLFMMRFLNVSILTW